MSKIIKETRRRKRKSSKRYVVYFSRFAPESYHTKLWAYFNYYMGSLFGGGHSYIEDTRPEEDFNHS